MTRVDVRIGELVVQGQGVDGRRLGMAVERELAIRAATHGVPGSRTREHVDAGSLTAGGDVDRLAAEIAAATWRALER